jgi:hypothetical protein
MKHIFISHSEKDDGLARELSSNLENRGHQTWMSCHDILLGDRFDREIKQALIQAYCVVVICTQFSTESRWVNGEIETALSYDKKVIPIIIGNCDLPVAWRMLQSIRWDSGRPLRCIDLLERALPETSISRFAKLLDHGDSLNAAKRIIRENVHWLPSEFRMRADYNVLFDAKIHGSRVVDVFSARMDSPGPRAQLYYFGDHKAILSCRMVMPVLS